MGQGQGAVSSKKSKNCRNWIRIPSSTLNLFGSRLRSGLFEPCSTSTDSGRLTRCKLTVWKCWVLYTLHINFFHVPKMYLPLINSSFCLKEAHKTRSDGLYLRKITQHLVVWFCVWVFSCRKLAKLFMWPKEADNYHSNPPPESTLSVRICHLDIA